MFPRCHRGIVEKFNGCRAEGISIETAEAFFSLTLIHTNGFASSPAFHRSNSNRWNIVNASTAPRVPLPIFRMAAMVLLMSPSLTT